MENEKINISSFCHCGKIGGRKKQFLTLIVYVHCSNHIHIIRQKIKSKNRFVLPFAVFFYVILNLNSQVSVVGEAALNLTLFVIVLSTFELGLYWQTYKSYLVMLSLLLLSFDIYLFPVRFIFSNAEKKNKRKDFIVRM